MHPVSVGCCGWSYKDWRGVFYPERLPESQFLPYYAEHFGIVEVDSSFYRCPSVRTVQAWRDKTPDGFGFSLKVPRSITHDKLLLDCRAELNEFLTAARALESKLWCCCLQFAYQNRKAFASLDRFLERLSAFLGDWPGDVPLAVEVRNKTWMVPKLFDCLREHKAALVLSDQLYMPSPLTLVQQHDVVTGPFGYVRLLGDRQGVDDLTPTLDHVVIDRWDQLEADAEAVRHLAERVPVMTFANNHYEGHGPETARRFGRALAGGGP
jgi:uncharacterized protein YecE (DUF72 family)